MLLEPAAIETFVYLEKLNLAKGKINVQNIVNSRDRVKDIVASHGAHKDLIKAII